MAINCDRTHRNFACIYMITFKRDGRRYIGQTVNFRRRMTEYVRNFKTYNPERYDWISYLQRTENVYDFVENFDVEILTYVGDKSEISPEEMHAELNYFEKFYIEKYGTQDKSFQKGFNYLGGGAATAPVSRKITIPTNNPRKSCFVYDTVDKTIEMYTTFKSVEMDLQYYDDSMCVSRIKRAYYAGLILNKRWRLYPANGVERLKFVKRIISERYDAIKKLYDTRDESTSASILHLQRFILEWGAAEKLIDVQYCYDDLVSIKAMRVISWCEDIIETLSRWHKQLSAKDADFDYILYMRKEREIRLKQVFVVDSITEEIRLYNDIRDAGKDIGLHRTHILEKIRTDEKACGRYYLYYADPDLREAVWNDIRKLHPVDTSKRKENRYKYALFYYRIAKLQDIDFFE